MLLLYCYILCHERASSTQEASIRSTFAQANAQFLGKRPLADFLAEHVVVMVVVADDDDDHHHEMTGMLMMREEEMVRCYCSVSSRSQQQQAAPAAVVMGR